MSKDSEPSSSPDILRTLVYSQFDEKVGPKARITFPKGISDKIKNKISLKSINLLLGTKKMSDAVAIIPFPDIKMKGLIKTFEIRDETKRGGSIDSALTLVFYEIHDAIIYKYIKTLENKIIEIANELINLEEKKVERKKISEVIKSGFQNFKELINDLKQEEEKFEEKPFPEKKEFDEKSFYKFKILIVGDAGVGKTSIVLRYTNRAFRRSYIPTLGVNITEKTVQLENEAARFVIWDIAGHSKYQMMRNHYYEGANGVFLVFDLTRRDSFDNLSDWYQDVKKFLGKNVKGFILANKNDLKKQIKINNSDLKQLKNKLGLDVLKTSALTGENIDQAFEEIAKSLVKEK
ncbi:MAG: GTP-binding protein [Candidatus Lokiarchaeota archaeon]|nr:GTP-binding protein [Candidatus Lokiarchaeota archaeon]